MPIDQSWSGDHLHQGDQHDVYDRAATDRCRRPRRDPAQCYRRSDRLCCGELPLRTQPARLRLQFRGELRRKTVTLPLHAGLSGGRAVDYVITEASTRSVAVTLGVNFAPNLANAKGTAAVQHGRLMAGKLVFPAGVDFSPVRKVFPGPTGFPPLTARPGAVGEPGYSPLVELPNGVVINAPQLHNATGRADKVVNIDRARKQLTYKETDGFYEGRAVRYASFDASLPLAAALENATYAPALNAAPGEHSGRPTAREEIGIVTNGRTGLANPQRQGLSSALLDGADPLNILGEIPEPARVHPSYSPLWDANLATWTPAAKAAGRDLRQTDFRRLRELADAGLITAPDGSAFGPSGFLINCPAISITR